MPSFKKRLTHLYDIDIGIETIRFTLANHLDTILTELEDEQNPHVVVFYVEQDAKCLKPTGSSSKKDKPGGHLF